MNKELRFQVQNVIEFYVQEAVTWLKRELTLDNPSVDSVTVWVKKGIVVAIQVSVRDGLATHRIAKTAKSDQWDLFRMDIHTGWFYVAGGQGQYQLSLRLQSYFGSRCGAYLFRRDIVDRKFYLRR